GVHAVEVFGAAAVARNVVDGCNVRRTGRGSRLERYVRRNRRRLGVARNVRNVRAGRAFLPPAAPVDAHAAARGRAVARDDLELGGELLARPARNVEESGL